MDLIKFNGLPENPEFNQYEMTKLLLDNGVDGYRVTPFVSGRHDILIDSFGDGYHTNKSLERLLEHADIELPKQPFFSLFYYLDTDDGRVAYHHGPHFKEYLTMMNPELEQIVNIGKGLSKIVRMPVVAIYEGERWALPKFQVYEHGEVIRESVLFGGEQYDPDFAAKDDQKVSDNCDKMLRSGFLNGFNKSLLK